MKHNIFCTLTWFCAVIFSEALPIDFGYPTCNSWLFVLLGLLGLAAVVALVGITIWWQSKRPADSERAPLVAGSV